MGSDPTTIEELASVSEGVFGDCEGSFLGSEAPARTPPTSLGTLAVSWHSVPWASAEPFFLVPGKEAEAVPGRESGCQPDSVYLHSTHPTRPSYLQPWTLSWHGWLGPGPTARLSLPSQELSKESAPLEAHAAG